MTPRENPDLIGHPEAERTLLSAWLSGRMAHAWLIGGPAGIGKATLAFRFARFVLARGRAGQGGGLDLFGAPPPPPASLHLAPDDPVFRRVRAGGHTDLMTVERRYDDKRGKMKTEIAVDDVRDVSTFLRHTAGEDGWRVVIIDGVEQMNASGHNALLKVLEEPPEQALLLLVSETPGGLLPTIRSRCRTLLLRPLPEAAVAGWLDTNRPDLADSDRATLARLAEGSIGRALSLAGAGGLDLYRHLITVLTTLPRLDLKAALAFADSVTRKGEDDAWDTATGLVVWWLARLVKALAEGRLPEEITAGEGALLQRLAAAQPGLDRWLEVWEKASQLFARADAANLDRKQVVLNALLSIEAALP
ncbi:MAG: DNA polymerase III subunit delta' [Rhodospirillaceae bacterium]